MPSAVDLHVGRALRARRRLTGKSQAALGAEVGITHQHVAKLESARSAMSVTLLWKLAQALDHPVCEFFANMDRSAA